MTEPSNRCIRSRKDLERYVGHFNAKEYAQQIAYYAGDVQFKVGTLTLSSPQQIADFYADFHQHCHEHIQLVKFALTGDVCAAAMATRFEPFRDYRQHGLTFLAGTPVDIVSLIFYTLRQGKIWRIRMARYGGTRAEFVGD